MTRTFDRIPIFDERSREYPVRELGGYATPISRRWPCDARLDQGMEGACVGFGLAHELAAEPVVCDVDAQFARERIYWEAQKIDQYRGGAYPGASPQTEGTSVLAGLKVLKRLGACDGYQWQFGFADFLYGLSFRGPAILGVSWYEGMLEPEADGRIRPYGKQIGGHCCLADELDVERGRIWILNSWGKDWGIDGRCYVTYADMRALLRFDGEAAFLTGRKHIDKDTAKMNSRTWLGRFLDSLRGAGLAVGISALGLCASGCASIATYHQARADYEHEARMSQARGLGPVVRLSEDTPRIPVDEVGAWDIIAANWPDFLKSAGLDVGLAIGAYYLYRHRGDDGDRTYISNTYNQQAGEDAADDDAGGDESGE